MSAQTYNTRFMLLSLFTQKQQFLRTSYFVTNIFDVILIYLILLSGKHLPTLHHHCLLLLLLLLLHHRIWALLYHWSSTLPHHRHATLLHHWELLLLHHVKLWIPRHLVETSKPCKKRTNITIGQKVCPHLTKFNTSQTLLLY